MKTIVLLFLLAGQACAGDIYTCTDKAGKRQIQSLPCEAGQRETYRQSFTVQKTVPVAARVYVAPPPPAYKCTTYGGRVFYRSKGCPDSSPEGLFVSGNSTTDGTPISASGSFNAPVRKEAIPRAIACREAESRVFQRTWDDSTQAICTDY